MRLIITRHGETEENAAGILQGHRHGTLNANGRAQADRVAQRLRDVPLDAIYTSDLRRALHTAQRIAKEHPEAAFIVTEDLRERDLGSWTGKHRDTVDWDTLCPLQESHEAVRARAERVLRRVLSDHPEGTVLLVGHGGINRWLLMVALDETYEESKQRHPRFRNTSVSEIVLRGVGDADRVLIDCVAHLD